MGVWDPQVDFHRDVNVNVNEHIRNRATAFFAARALPHQQPEVVLKERLNTLARSVR
jgi:hypothetical protein